MEKVCKKCKRTADIIHFPRHTLTKDGYLSTCKECVYKGRGKSKVDIPLTKECEICKKDKSSLEFIRNNRAKDGLCGICIECWDFYDITENLKKDKNFVRKLRLQKNSEYRDKLRALKRISTKRIHNVKSRLLKNAQKRASLLNKEFNLDIEDIVIPEYCPILKVKLIPGEKDNYKFSPSLDRIDNNLGYVKGNVQVISTRANVMKNDSSFEELILFANWVYENIRYSPNCEEKELTEL